MEELINSIKSYFKEKHSVNSVFYLEKIKQKIRSRTDTIYFINCPVCGKEFKSLYPTMVVNMLLNHFENQHRNLI